MSTASGSRAPARPKRAGEEFSRTQFRPGGEPSSKKARFDARNPSTLVDDDPEEDPILEMDVIGAKGQQAKRNAVELDGYESDSSNENFDARAQAKADSQKKTEKSKAAKSKDEEDNDMFADLDEDFADGDDDGNEDGPNAGKKRKKEVRFLDDRDIEGQVASSKSGGHVSADFSLNGKGKHKDAAADNNSDDDDDDDSGDDEERDKIGDEVDEELGAGSKKKHAPKLDAFNMRNEAEEGRFDDSGNFIRKAADPYAVHDSWLEGSSKAEMKRAKEAQDKREQERRAHDMADDAVPTSTILSTLISRMEESETVLEALARLGTAKERKPKPKWQKNKRKPDPAMETEDDERAHAAGNAEADVQRREAVEAITAAADQLLTRGQTEIYEAERALLIRQYRRETGEAWVDSNSTNDQNEESKGGPKEWEYRWSDARDGGERHGPYDGPTMKAWSEAGYFGDGVEFKQVGDGDGWSRTAQFV